MVLGYSKIKCFWGIHHLKIGSVPGPVAGGRGKHSWFAQLCCKIHGQSRKDGGKCDFSVPCKLRILPQIHVTVSTSRDGDTNPNLPGHFQGWKSKSKPPWALHPSHGEILLDVSPGTAWGHLLSSCPCGFHSPKPAQPWLLFLSMSLSPSHFEQTINAYS